MTVSFRSLLTIFLAVLGLFAFDGAEAKKRGKGGKHKSEYGNPKNCGKRNKKCCRGDKPCKRWLACVKHNKNQKRCKPCGGNNQIVCPGQDPKCRDGLIVKHQPVHVPDICVKPPCGKLGEPCCRGKNCFKKDFLSCQASGHPEVKSCQKCGSTDKPCCNNRKNPCKAGNVCKDHKCKACGHPGQPCCGSGKCNGPHNYCSNGHCVEPTCDKKGDKCCPDGSCKGSLNCRKRNGYKQCIKCGGHGERCCDNTHPSCKTGFECQDTKRGRKCLPPPKH